MDPARSSAPGLYVHVPFCLKKCRYCAFYSQVAGAGVDAWIDCVAAEASMLAPSFGAFDAFDAFDTLYIGGGTPSLLTETQFERLVRAVRDRVRLCDEVEVTLEVNPADVSPAKAHVWRSLGVNRVSVGVQSFDDGALRFLGRRHNRAAVVEALQTLRDEGFVNLSIDLIWALPSIAPRVILHSVEQALAWNPEHMCCYELTIEPSTPLHVDVSKGRVVPIKEETTVAVGEASWRVLRQHGYDHYEVSSFAKDPRLRSKHNRKYWSHVPYLGLGPAAHSFDGVRRWANVSSVSAYCAALERQERAVVWEETLSARQLQSERVALGIRTSEGVAMDQVNHRAVPRLEQLGLVTITADRVVATRRGLWVADALALELDTDDDHP